MSDKKDNKEKDEDKGKEIREFLAEYKDEEGNWYYQDLGSENGSYRILSQFNKTVFPRYEL